MYKLYIKCINYTFLNKFDFYIIYKIYLKLIKSYIYIIMKKGQKLNENEKGMKKGQKKVTNKNSKMYDFLRTYKFNSSDLQDFIDVFYSEFIKSRKITAKRILKISILNKKLTPTCRAFILFKTNNFKEQRNIVEVIVEKEESSNEEDEESSNEEEKSNEDDSGNDSSHSEEEISEEKEIVEEEIKEIVTDYNPPYDEPDDISDCYFTDTDIIYNKNLEAPEEEEEKKPVKNKKDYGLDKYDNFNQSKN